MSSRPGPALCVALAALLAACAANHPKTAPATAGAAVPPAIRSVGCVDVPALTSKDTPADILPGMRQCIEGRDYVRAARLFAVADTYGRFDAFRVQDPTAQEVIPALESAYLGNLDKEAADEVVAKTNEISASPQELSSLCAQVRSLGPPAYYPTYMTSHGMSAFKGRDAGLRKHFDRASAWESALKAVLKCPGR